MNRIAVLIPCYNESRTIGKVVRDYKEALPEASVYVYDNNSTDGSAELAREAGAIVRHEYKQGKGNVMRRMFMEIDADCYLMVDGDDTYPAESARQMIDAVLTRKADMVIGDRLSSTYYDENKRLFHNFGNTIVKKSINILFHSDITDIMTGYRAFSYRFVKTFPVLSEGFEIETEMTIHAIDKNMEIDNVIVQYRDRPEGSESKLDTVGDGIKVLMTIINFYRIYRPLQFFSGLSLVMIIIAFAFFIPVFASFIATHTVTKIPTLVVCGFVALASIQSFFSGMILNSLKQKERQDFEIKLHQVSRPSRED
ncbi:MAG: glycosyltransferase family 2 protein [Lachnospiraceae bacterium]|nr:glycosyltransferase family 2 protein [Lachnospiraceae bacterium]